MMAINKIKLTQVDQVVAALEQNGGYATFSDLNHIVDTSEWKTKTPAASIRGIVQTHPKLFYRLMPGQWGLISMKTKIENGGVSVKSEKYTHGYYQGLLVDIGNAKKFLTYVPPQDKNRDYSHQKLGKIITMPSLVEFTTERIMRKAKTVDTIWMNCRDMPDSFFEVEHTTDIRNSLDKFYELQDFRANFFIVSDAKNKARFDDLLMWSQYKEIKDFVRFYDYEKLFKLHASTMVALEVSMD